MVAEFLENVDKKKNKKNLGGGGALRPSLA
jgi:hypothetical protein